MKWKLQMFVIILCNLKHYLCNYTLFGFVKSATDNKIRRRGNQNSVGETFKYYELFCNFACVSMATRGRGNAH